MNNKAITDCLDETDSGQNSESQNAKPFNKPETLDKILAFFKNPVIRLGAEFALSFILVERIFYWFTAMPYDHKSLSGHSTMLMWHFVPYMILAVVIAALIETVFQLATKLWRKS